MFCVGMSSVIVKVLESVLELNYYHFLNYPWSVADVLMFYEMCVILVHTVVTLWMLDLRFGRVAHFAAN